ALRNVPFTKYGGLRFLEAAHVKDFVCTLRLVENPVDEVAWFRVLQLVDGVGPATARRVLRADACRGRGGGGAGVWGGLLEGGAELCAMLIDARASVLRSRAGAQVDRVRVWLDPMIRRRYPRAAPRLADLDQLAQAAAASPSLSRFLVDLAIDPPASTGDLA